MKKILLIDDETDKQNSLLEQYGIDFTKYMDILDNLTGEESMAFFIGLDMDDESFLQYKVWIIHQTLFNKLKGMKRRVERFCKQNTIQLVLFSGSVSTVMIKPKTGLLKMSRDDLYKNLTYFLEHSKSNEPQLEILGFGDNWIVPLLSNVEDSIEKFLATEGQSISSELFKSQINNLELAVKILGKEDFLNLTASIDRDVIVSLLYEIQEVKKEQLEM